MWESVIKHHLHSIKRTAPFANFANIFLPPPAFLSLSNKHEKKIWKRKLEREATSCCLCLSNKVRLCYRQDRAKAERKASADVKIVCNIVFLFEKRKKYNKRDLKSCYFWQRSVDCLQKSELIYQTLKLRQYSFPHLKAEQMEQSVC